MNANVSVNVTSELSREFIAFACELGVLRLSLIHISEPTRPY